MKASASPKQNLLPKIGSPQFKALDYKEQLAIYKMFMFEQPKYVEAAGPVDDELRYVDESIANLFKLPSSVGDVSPFPVSFRENCWCAYLSYFNPTWWEEGDSPLDYVDVSHKRIFSIQLFNFPLLSFHREAFVIMKWLMGEPHKTRKGNDILFHIVRMTTAFKLYQEKDALSLLDPVGIWNSSVHRLGKIQTIEDLREIHPVIEANEKLIDLVDLDVLAPLTSFVKSLPGHRYFVPLVPGDLYSKDQFYIKGWDFLGRSA